MADAAASLDGAARAAPFDAVAGAELSAAARASFAPAGIGRCAGPDAEVLEAVERAGLRINSGIRLPVAEQTVDD